MTILHEIRVAVKPRPNPLGERSRAFLRSKKENFMIARSGYCKCGCGNKVGIRARTVSHSKKGDFCDFLPGHHSSNNIEIFWFQVIKTESCWIWTGKLNNKGYGTFCYQGFHYAHRFSYALHNNLAFQDLNGRVIMHKCDNPKCVNPEHLTIGTQQDNINDCLLKGRTCRGEKQGRSKLKSEDVRNIRYLFANEGKTPRELAYMFNVHKNHISAIIRKRFWGHI